MLYLNSTSISRTPANLKEYEGDRQFATTLARGIELLRCFSPERPVLGNKDLSRLLNLPPATVNRLTYTLTCLGLLTQTEHYGKYQLGSAVLSLGYPLLTQFSIRKQARGLMRELAQNIEGSVSIGIRDRLTMTYIDAIRSYGNQTYPLDIGTSHSLAGTALGRAYLMACRVSDREALLNQLRVKAPDEWAKYGKKLMENIEGYGQWGCCVSVGEIFSDVQAVAVPMGALDRGELAAMNCAFQGRRLDEAWLKEKIAPQLQAVVRQLI